MAKAKKSKPKHRWLIGYARGLWAFGANDFGDKDCTRKLTAFQARRALKRLTPRPDPDAVIFELVPRRLRDVHD